MSEHKFVIAISGPSGSGKSSLIEALRAQLPVVRVEHENSFGGLLKMPDALNALLRSNATYERMDISPVLEGVEEFHRQAIQRDFAEQNSIRNPAFENVGLMLIESDLGRAHPRLRKYIDMQFWISVSAEQTLARRVSRELQLLREGQSTVDGLRNIEQLCRFVHSERAELYDSLCFRISREATHWINGTGSISYTAGQIVPIVCQCVVSQSSR